ncbi:cupin domain-containing protein [Mastigocoleus testarum]|uniref:ChrR-like cupin domain-containing protein n=1 Tax=Mastigocoleus testarum BC008 TaxID=371196 RepID=A0A0V7ZBA1_9CYAN|nr:DUF4437 domain-containing protein [Mastigocoleus testarum]KST61779.1 hypothetical protein BC008_06965 [Mastigocoleus testarum BC008]
MLSKVLEIAKTIILKFTLITISLVVLFTGILFPTQSALSLEKSNSTIANLSSLSWKPIDGIPQGAQVAVLNGNTTKGASEVMIRLPAGYTFPHHSHSSREVLFLSEGEITYIADDGNKQKLPANSYLDLPSGTKHSVLCGQNPCLVFARYEQPFDLILSPAPKTKS